MATSNLVTASGEVMFHTGFSHAEEILIFGLWNPTIFVEFISLGTSISAAMAFRSATQLCRCISTIHVFAMYGSSFGPMFHAYRTME
jgi:hypothetical protein